MTSGNIYLMKEAKMPIKGRLEDIIQRDWKSMRSFAKIGDMMMKAG